MQRIAELKPRELRRTFLAETTKTDEIVAKLLRLNWHLGSVGGSNRLDLRRRRKQVGDKDQLKSSPGKMRPTLGSPHTIRKAFEHLFIESGTAEATKRIQERAAIGRFAWLNAEVRQFSIGAIGE